MIELWAEAGPCDNSVAKAHDYVRAVADAGAAAIKVQWYNADTLVVPDTPRYDHTGGPAETQYEMFKHAIYPYERWLPVVNLAREQGIEFIPSVFDHEAIDYFAELGLSTIKIASADITYHDLIRHADEVSKRIAISTGAATLDEISDMLEIVNNPSDVILLACHLEYPTPLERANIARTYDLQTEFFECQPGFSDHTPGISSFPLIVATGVTVIEKHFTLEGGHGYDSDFALTPSDLRNGVISIERTLALMGDASVTPTTEEMDAREGARRSLYTSRAVPAGEPLAESDIAVLRPGTGLAPYEATQLIGMAPDKDLQKHHRFSWEDFS